MLGATISGCANLDQANASQSSSTLVVSQNQSSEGSENHQGSESEGFDRAIDHHIFRLRKQIKVNGYQPIQPVYGAGYKFVMDVVLFAVPFSILLQSLYPPKWGNYGDMAWC